MVTALTTYLSVSSESISILCFMGSHMSASFLSWCTCMLCSLQFENTFLQKWSKINMHNLLWYVSISWKWSIYLLIPYYREVDDHHLAWRHSLYLLDFLGFFAVWGLWGCSSGCLICTAHDYADTNNITPLYWFQLG